MNKNKNQIIIIFLISIIVFVGAVGFGWWLSNQMSGSSESTSTGVVVQNNQQQSSIKSDKTNTKSTEKDDKKKNSDDEFKREKEKPPLNQYEGEINQDEITAVINSKSVQNNQLLLRVTINQQLSTGTCDLTLVNQATQKTVNKQVKVIQNPSSASCAGFDVPLNELGIGQWSVKIDIKSGAKAKTLNTMVTIR